MLRTDDADGDFRLSVDDAGSQKRTRMGEDLDDAPVRKFRIEGGIVQRKALHAAAVFRLEFHRLNLVVENPREALLDFVLLFRVQKYSRYHRKLPFNFKFRIRNRYRLSSLQAGKQSS